MPRTLLVALVVSWSIAGLPVLASHSMKVFSSQQVVPEGAGKAVVYMSWGHRIPVDEFIDAATLERYELISPDGSVSHLKKDGQSLQVNSVELMRPGVYGVAAVRKPSVYSHVYGDDGQWQLKRGGKTEHPGRRIESSTRYQQCASTLVFVGKPGGMAPKPLGLPIEIVPLDVPAGWKVNADIRFKVLLNGKPAVGADVQARHAAFQPDDAWCYSTGSNRNGEFMVRPGQNGAWVVKAVVKNLVGGTARQQYDLDCFVATFTLEVGP